MEIFPTEARVKKNNVSENHKRLYFSFTHFCDRHLLILSLKVASCFYCCCPILHVSSSLDSEKLNAPKILQFQSISNDMNKSYMKLRKNQYFPALFIQTNGLPTIYFWQKGSKTEYPFILAVIYIFKEQTLQSVQKEGVPLPPKKNRSLFYFFRS